MKRMRLLLCPLLAAALAIICAAGCAMSAVATGAPEAQAAASPPAPSSCPPAEPTASPSPAPGAARDIVAETMGRDGLKVRFFDVPELEEKWGDCTYFELPDGSNMLVDCGTKAAGAYIVSDLLARGVGHIDIFVISHFHSDHVGGYTELVENIGIGRIYSNGYVAEQFKWVEEDIAARGIPYERLAAGDSFALGGADFEVLWPLAELVAEDPALDASNERCVMDTNNRSMVLRVEYGNVALLMTGDVYKQGQRDILAAYAESPEKLDADVVKVPHHGYDNAVNADFIKAVSPGYAVMEGNHVMTNVSYSIYKKAGCTAYATWMNGDVLVLTDGETLEVFARSPQINDYYK